jgi:choline-sulfatase
MPAQRFADRFNPRDMKLPDTWGKVDLAQVPKEIRASIQRSQSTPELAQPGEAKKRIAFYHANLMQVDDCIGQVLAALEKQGLADDTIVVYTSDHGEMLGEHGLWQKFVFYEDSVRVPLTVRVPGVGAGVCRNHVSHVDLFPTLTELCGIKTPAKLDGASLVPMLQAPAKAMDRTVFSEFALHQPGRKWMVRQGHHKYTKYSDMEELFDLASDPQEMTNLATRQPELIAQFRTKLSSWHPPAFGASR